MKKVNKTLIGGASAVMGLILTNFAFSKLLGVKDVVTQFNEMAKPLGINPDFFRLFTGAVILVISVSYLVSAGINLFKANKKLSLKTNEYRLNVFANSSGIIVMSGALLAEFFLRSTPKIPLVLLAALIILISTMNLKTILKNIDIRSLFKIETDNTKNTVLA